MMSNATTLPKWLAMGRSSTPTCPNTAYGSMKSDAEIELTKFRSHVSILRLSKVLTPQTPTIANWIEELKKRRPIAPFSDAVISPISLELALRALYELGEEFRSGLFQLSANKDISYATIARHLAHRFEVDPELVQPTTSGATGWKGEVFPVHTTLDCRRLTETIGIESPDPWLAVDEILSISSSKPHRNLDSNS